MKKKWQKNWFQIFNAKRTNAVKINLSYTLYGEPFYVFSSINVLLELKEK